jgi:hypothetical protein
MADEERIKMRKKPEGKVGAVGSAVSSVTTTSNATTPTSATTTAPAATSVREIAYNVEEEVRTRWPKVIG